jgi:HPt (histidine-containing phosphotransfer) domain-containing protein
MKNVAIALVCVVLSCASTLARQGGAGDSDALKGIVASYVEIQTSLAADQLDQVKRPARTLASQAQALRKDGAAIAKTATALEQAPDLAAARTAFGQLSEAVIARLNADDGKEARANVRLAYCPMVRKTWLQREEQIRNPYGGKAMLTCGEFKK